MTTIVKYFFSGVTILLTLASLLFSPYRLELDLDEPQVDDASVELLRMLYFIVLFIATLFYIRFRSFKSVAGAIILLTAIYSAIKLTSTFFL